MTSCYWKFLHNQAGRPLPYRTVQILPICKLCAYLISLNPFWLFHFFIFIYLYWHFTFIYIMIFIYLFTMLNISHLLTEPWPYICMFVCHDVNLQNILNYLINIINIFLKFLSENHIILTVFPFIKTMKGKTGAHTFYRAVWYRI